jgi:type II protein arginine methyltransferase
MNTTTQTAPQNLTEQVLKFGSLSPAALKFVSMLVERVKKPELPVRLAKMALIFKGRKQKSDAQVLAQAARSLAPDDIRVRVLTDWLNRHQAPLWHFRIVHDHLRNEAYAKALQHFVKPGMVVFEIGAGTGLLAMLAARAGAKHVYTCERRPDVAAAAKEIIAQNGLADRVTVIPKDANALQLGIDLPERADLFVAEIVDNTLLGEGVLPLTDLAKLKFLKPDAILLPQRVSAMGYLMAETQHIDVYRMSSVMGFDLTPFNCFTPLELNAGEGGGGVNPVSDAIELIGFDLNETAPNEATEIITLTANRDASVHSLLRWLRLDFGDDIVFENRPPQKSSWDPHLHILPTPINVRAGQSLQFEINHNRDQLFISPI